MNQVAAEPLPAIPSELEAERETMLCAEAECAPTRRHLWSRPDRCLPRLPSTFAGSPFSTCNPEFIWKMGLLSCLSKLISLH
jgi:hypothetical protein